MVVLIPWHRFPPFEMGKVGGLAVVVWELTREMQRQGSSVEILVPGMTSEDITTEIEGVKVTSSALGAALANDSALSSDQEKTLEAYDCILSIQGLGGKSLSGSERTKRRVTRQMHNVLSAIPLSYSLRLRPTPFEYARNIYLKRKQEANERRLRGTRTVCVSRHLVELMLETHLEKEGNLHQVPNGVDTGAFYPKASEKHYDLLFVGGYYWVKGIDLLLQSVSRLHQDGFAVKLAIAGNFNNEERSRLFDSVPPSVRTNIVFLGVVDHGRMPDAINSARLAVVPSRYETFGMVALEAMACGVPVVASRAGALPELVDETVGRLVEPMDGTTLSMAIKRSMTDESLMLACLTNGPARAKRYEWGEVVRRLSAVINLQ